MTSCGSVKNLSHIFIVSRSGHRSAVITEVYAELDQQKAMEAIVRVG